MAYDLYDLTESLSQVGLAREDIEACLLGFGYSPEGYGSWTGGFVLKLRDGRWALVCGWCDTTGWGCQDGANIWTWMAEPTTEAIQEKVREYTYDLDCMDEADPHPADINRWIKGEVGRWGEPL